ncbi:Retrovirus-related Pol polyprotein from transposon RE1 [Vitis vinifera]|uniref:Retrovirus-related Pol polyprotein from transposon RE1 n=1 Tax=Vitis vinifera TaxID=29760 RepID=A0A438EGE1_VITVI|nr:Retrovirus-related Pol polyprotein from transposon RE1 [Vitis vinifera]
MMEDSPYESFEPLDLPHVSTHGDEEPVSSPVPASVTHNFPQFLRCIQGKRPFQNKSRSKNPNSDLGNEITADGSLERHKARLVTKGYTQTYGVDYQEIFALVAKMNTVRILLSLVAHYNWQLLQHDVKNAFLHGDLDEEIYMNIPPGFEENTGNIGCKPVSTPMDPNHKLGEAKEEPMVDKRMYQRLVGRLIYLAHTRPDIAYSVSLISQFMHDPREPHLQPAYREFPTGLRSTTGYCTFLGGNLVTWRSKKQNVVARLSAESEFRAIAQGLYELLWLKIILNDLRIKWDGPMKLYCDNKSAINIAHNPIQHDRTKHNEIDRHFIKEKLEEGVGCMSYVLSEHQLADILTKGAEQFNVS